MLFRNNMPRSCSYCSFGTKQEDNRILCTKCGIVEDTHSCRRFKYDPLKRQPLNAKTPDFSSFKDEDFKL